MKLQFRERLHEILDGTVDAENMLMLHIENYIREKFTIDEEADFPHFVFDIILEIEAWDHDSSPYNKNAV